VPDVLKNKTVVLGVTGGIAAFKIVDLASQMTRAGAVVKVVMTQAATKLVTPFTFRSLTGQPVVTDMWAADSEFAVEHVKLGEIADIVVIAPATANTIAKLAAGIADNELGAIVLATKAPVLLVPSMNTNMLQNPATQENLAKLRARGFIIVEPVVGRLATGRVGAGRLPDAGAILQAVGQILGRAGDLAGNNFIVTAGGTQEPIDPVRFVTNRSSGKMGYAVAEAARDRGASVTLVTAPTALAPPVGVIMVNVTTAQEMLAAVIKAVKSADALIMAAAVADYRPVQASESKIKRQKAEQLTLKLVRTPDILATVKGKFLRVGFAAETDNLERNAREKLARKKLDLIVANDVKADEVFGADTNRAVIIDRNGKVERLPVLAKRELADRILDHAVGLLPDSRKPPAHPSTECGPLTP